MRKALFFLALLALVGVSGYGAAPTAVAGGPPFNCNQVNLHPGTLSNGQVSVAYSAVLWLTPANAALQVNVTNVTGTLPPGLGFTPGPNINQVTLAGTPTTTGTYTFTVELGGTYVLGTICKQSQTYTVTIF